MKSIREWQTEVHALAVEKGLDLGAAMVQKHAYNATRPHKHGKKI